MPAAEAPSADTYSISTDYFRVMKIPLKCGRVFTKQDRNGAPLVAVISESCEHIKLGGRNDNKPWITIVGIAGDVRQYSLDRASKMEV